MNRTVWAAAILASFATCASAAQLPPGGVISGVPKGVYATIDLANRVREQAAMIPAVRHFSPQMATSDTTALQDNRPLRIYRRIGRERHYNR